MCSLPMMVQSLALNSAPGPPAPSPSKATASGAPASMMQSRSTIWASGTACSGPVMQRSSVTFAKGCSTTRLTAPGSAAVPSGLRLRPGTSVQSRRINSRGSSSAVFGTRRAPPLTTKPSMMSVPRAPSCSTTSPAATNKGRAGLLAETTTRWPGAPLASTASTLKTGVSV